MSVAATSTGSSGAPVNKDSFIADSQLLAKEISKGVWNGKQDPLCLKIRGLMGKLVIESPQDASHKEFVASLDGLANALSKIDNKSYKVQQLAHEISHLGNVSKEGDVKKLDEVINLAVTKNLPHDSPENIKASLEVFRALSKKNSPFAVRALAQWIDHNTIPLAKLNLTQAEIKAISPFLSHLDLTNYEISGKELPELLSLFKNLRALIILNDSADILPPLPPTLQKLTVQGENFREVQALHEGLTHIDLSDCPRLAKLPQALPKTTVEFNCDKCVALVALPALNAGLRKLVCSNCPLLEFPDHLNGSLRHFDCNGCSMQALPVMEKDVTYIDCRNCNNLVDIRALPSELVVLDARQCEKLTSLPAVLPGKLEKLHVSFCPELILPNMIPPTVAVSR